MKAYARIDAGKFRITVTNILESYSADVLKATAVAVHEVAEEAKDELKTAGSFKGTKYRRSWKVKEVQTSVYTEATVYNEKHYRLTHLLEFGHQKQNGGRTKAFAHIAPVNDKVDKLFQEKMEAILGRTV